MTSFDISQADFAAAIRDPGKSPPATVRALHPGALARRFTVYRNTVYAGLIGVLEARFPAVRRLVGEQFFRAMARRFVDRTPPRSPVLLDYGADFAAFLTDFKPVADEPYLPDVARLEWRMHRARHAADGAALGPAELASVAGQRAADLRLVLAQPVSLVTSAFPVFSLWRANIAETAGGPCTFSGAEYVLVTRPALAPEAIRISHGSAAFIAALLEDKPLGAAASAAFAADPDFALDRTLALLIVQGAISALAADRPDCKESRP
jgi:hypothetical protein